MGAESHLRHAKSEPQSSGLAGLALGVPRLPPVDRRGRVTGARRPPPRMSRPDKVIRSIPSPVTRRSPQLAPSHSGLATVRTPTRPRGRVAHHPEYRDGYTLYQLHVGAHHGWARRAAAAAELARISWIEDRRVDATKAAIQRGLDEASDQPHS